MDGPTFRTTSSLILLIFFTGLGTSGGLSETLVIYPSWKEDPTPATLTEKIGELQAKRRAQILATGFAYVGPLTLVNRAFRPRVGFRSDSLPPPRARV